jgi:DNA (cytosine-5)-methyltransferase 1
MGLPDGWVTGVPGLSRPAQLTALGNGVVPQQAAHALTLITPREALDCGHRHDPPEGQLPPGHH